MTKTPNSDKDGGIDCDAREVLVNAKTLELLYAVASTSTNLVRSRGDSEFAELCGGEDVLNDQHTCAVLRYEIWMGIGVELDYQTSEARVN